MLASRSTPMRNHILRWLLGGAAALLVCMPSLAGPVLLISIDGLPPRYVLDADRLRLEIPHLRRLAAQGAYATGVIAAIPTVTYPNHTTLVTGVSPAVHGISTNTTFDPMNTNLEGWFWYAEDIRVPTLWSAAQAARLSTASVNWPVSVGDKHIDYLLPEYWRTSGEDDQKLMRALARPEGLIARLESQLGPFVDGNRDTLESDRVRTAFAVAVLREYRPKLMGVHLVALDGTQHREGPDSQAAFDVLEQLDSLVGQLITAAREQHPEITVAVVSDHGFIATHTAVNLRTEFVKAGLITLAAGTGRISGWTAQVWPGGGSAGIVLRQPQDADLLRRVRELLDRLAADPRQGIARVLDAAELRRLGAFPEASLAVEFAPGFYLGTALQGPLLIPATSKGTHGYLAQRPEMHASFFIAGPQVPPGLDLGVIDMRQIAPTLARTLGVALPQATHAPVSLTAPVSARAAECDRRPRECRR